MKFSKKLFLTFKIIFVSPSRVPPLIDLQNFDSPSPLKNSSPASQTFPSPPSSEYSKIPFHLNAGDIDTTRERGNWIGFILLPSSNISPLHSYKKIYHTMSSPQARFGPAYPVDQRSPTPFPLTEIFLKSTAMEGDRGVQGQKNVDLI